MFSFNPVVLCFQAKHYELISFGELIYGSRRLLRPCFIFHLWRITDLFNVSISFLLWGEMYLKRECLHLSQLIASIIPCEATVSRIPLKGNFLVGFSQGLQVLCSPLFYLDFRICRIEAKLDRNKILSLPCDLLFSVYFKDCFCFGPEVEDIGPFVNAFSWMLSQEILHGFSRLVIIAFVSKDSGTEFHIFNLSKYIVETAFCSYTDFFIL